MAAMQAGALAFADFVHQTRVWHVQMPVLFKLRAGGVVVELPSHRLHVVG
jgi:hypothetical protein